MSESDRSAATERPTGPAPQGAPRGGAPVSSGPSAAPGLAHAASSSAPVEEPHQADVQAGAVPQEEQNEGESNEFVEVLTSDIEKLVAEREEYLGSLRQLQADFENYKKRILKQQTEHLERAAAGLVGKLLPVLDSFDLALAHGAQDAEPVYRNLLGVLESEGLERLDPLDKPFDPNEHEAVAHEPGDVEPPQVSEVLRAGYRWKGRVLRPAMVKVRG